MCGQLLKAVLGFGMAKSGQNLGNGRGRKTSPCALAEWGWGEWQRGEDL